MKFIICIIYLIFYISSTNQSATFTEKLLIKPLYEQVIASFQFATNWDVHPDSDAFNSNAVFRRTLGDIVRRYNVQELHVSLTKGLWRYDMWGYPAFDAAPGVELWSRFKAGTRDVDACWKLLAKSLSGPLCASLDFVDMSNSVSPEFTFKPSGVADSPNVNNSYLRYTSLPQEIICSEDLHSWIKLLPCDLKGLVTLLNPGHIHKARYHSVALHLHTIHQDKSQPVSLELQQSVLLVYDYVTLGPTKNWSLKTLFGQDVTINCNLANRSEIYVDTTTFAVQCFKLAPPPDEVITCISDGYVRTLNKYNVYNSVLHISATCDEPRSLEILSPPLLYSNRFLTDHGRGKKGIKTKIYNNHGSSLDVVFLQNIPWYIPIYFHTFKVTTNGADNKPVALRYTAGKYQEQPHYLEVTLMLPPRSTSSVIIDFDYALLLWQEYPRDGIYIGSAVISSYVPAARNYTGLPSESFNTSRSEYLVELRSGNLVIALPNFDVNTNFDLICLTCTLMVLTVDHCTESQRMH